MSRSASTIDKKTKDRRSDNWLRELRHLDAAEAAGAGLLRICRLDDPAIVEVRGKLDGLKQKYKQVGCYLCAVVPKALAGDADTVYQPPPPPAPELNYNAETKESLAKRLKDSGRYLIKNLPH